MAEQGFDLQAWRPGRTGGKITEKLLKLFEDEVNEDTDLDEAKGLILMAAVAWNLAVEPEIGKEMRKRLFAGLPAEARAAIRAHLEQMKQRKLALFPEDLRFVMRTDAHLQSDGDFYFTAAAAGYEDGSGRP